MTSRAATCRDAVKTLIEGKTYSLALNSVEATFHTESRDRKDFPAGTVRVYVSTAVNDIYNEQSPMSPSRAKTIDIIPIGISVIAGVAATDTSGIDPILELTEEIEDSLRESSSSVLGQFGFFDSQNIRAVDPDTTAKSKIVEFQFLANYAYARPKNH